ncbi:hypothetical protein ACFFF7_11915 [Novosphingobium aquiterrae]|uniref:Lipoprotein n=1 Tax=Novosphingobium aquiterrae TaxID=624388 RepID=A0ABV6PKN2_9SPHN
MRLRPMLSRMSAMTVLSALAIHLSGCDRAEPVPQASGTAEAVTAESAAAVPAPVETSLAILPKAVPPSTSRDPQEVLLSWAKAVSLKDWPTAYGYWGDHGAQSGMTLDQFKASWGKLQQPDLEIGKGDQEGAAGSSYYTVPITIIDGQRRIPGEVVLRRVNDVDGATSEQLRWHIESTTLKP